MQHLLVCLIVALAVAYASYRAWHALRNAGDPCAGCRGCAMREVARKAKKKKCNKKAVEKFGGYK